MYVKILSYIALGLILPYTLTLITSEYVAITSFFFLPFIALIHELLHYIPIRILNIDHEFIVGKLALGFKVRVHNSSEYLLLALSPQFLTLALFTLAAMGSKFALALAFYHIAISLEDLVRCIKYIPNSLRR